MRRIAVNVPLAVAGIYASGDSIGEKLSLASAVRVAGGTGTIETIRLTDLAAQNAALDVIFFADDPAVTVFTDNGALDVADAELPLILGVVKIVADDYAAFADNGVATVRDVGLAFQLDAGTTLYAALISRGTPTYATGDVNLAVTIRQD